VSPEGPRVCAAKGILGRAPVHSLPSLLATRYPITRPDVGVC